MRVYAYNVIGTEKTNSLDHVLRTLLTIPLNKRNKNIGGSIIRLEHAEKTESGIWFGDFVKWLKKGPGKAHPSKRFEGIKLEQNYKFASETGVLYDPELQVMLIEYNHIGAREGSISDYLSTFSGRPTGYLFNSIIDRDIESKWSHAGNIRKLEYSVAGLNVSDADRYAHASVGKTIDLQNSFKGDKIAVSISTSRGNDDGIDKEESSSLVDTLRKHITFGKKKANDPVKRLEVTAENEDSGISDVINFITPKLCVEFEVQVGEDQRYPRDLRWKSLARAYSNWIEKESFRS